MNDLHYLLLGDRKHAHRHVRIQIDIEGFEDASGLFPHGPSVYESQEADGRLVARGHVFAYREDGKQIEFLMDYPDSHASRMTRIPDRARLSVESNRSAIGLIDAAEDLDQSAFPRAVFPQQSVYFSFAQFEVDRVQRADSREILADAVDLENLRWNG